MRGIKLANFGAEDGPADATQIAEFGAVNAFLNRPDFNAFQEPNELFAIRNVLQYIVRISKSVDAEQ